MTSSWSPEADGQPARAEPWQGAPPPDRPHYRPPIGIPVPHERRLGSTLLAVGLHVLVILLLLTPVVGPAVLQEVQGAGGAGPAGGGGGGTMGTGGRQGLGVVERLHFIQVTPPPAPPTVTPPPQKPLPTPVTPPVTPPPEQKAPTPTPAPAPEQTAAATAPVAGTGGGTGADGTAGSGPGSGGGIGSGVGTGRGAGVGPGTGGGNAANYPPVATELFLPPWPVPDKVKGTQLVANFDVDSTGKVLAVEFTPTKDGGYNRKLKEVLWAVKFRPGTGPNGQPIRSKGSLTYVF